MDSISFSILILNVIRLVPANSMEILLTIPALLAMVHAMVAFYQPPTASTVLLATTGKSGLMLAGAVPRATMETTQLPSAPSAPLAVSPALLRLSALPASRWPESPTTSTTTNVSKSAPRLLMGTQLCPLASPALLPARLAQDHQLRA